ncbi:MAG TPA: DUF433 domain-containing protein, partial [Jatrophihabitans sp.]
MTALLDERTGAPDRFRAPLYTVTEAARYLGVPESTLGGWASGYRSRPAGRARTRPILTTVARQRSRRDAVIPFIGLAEGLVLTALRRNGVPLQRVRPALDRLEERFGIRHALASKWLYTDGVEVLYDYAEPEDGAELQDGGEPEDGAGAAPGRTADVAASDVAVVRSDQRVLDLVVESHLRRIEFAADGYACLIRLPGYQTAEVVVDPARGFGQPVFTSGGARVEDVLSMIRAGEDLATVAAEYRVPADQLRDAVRRDARR